MNLKNGLLVSFEGINGCGKSTVLNEVKKYFVEKYDSDTLTVRNYFCPGFAIPEVRSLIRKVNYKFTSLTYAALALSDIRELIVNYITPDLDKKRLVLVDRYVDSTVAYQSFVGDVDVEYLEEFINKFTNIVFPDLTFYLTTTYEQSVSRRKGEEKDTWESGNFEDTFKKLTKGFEYCYDTYKNIIKIDPDKTIDEISKECIDKIENTMKWS